MNKLFLVISFICFLFFISNTSYSKFEQSPYIPQCEKILSDLDHIIHQKKIKGNKKVTSVVDSCFNNFKEKKLTINITNSIPGNILQGFQCKFSTDRSTLPVILIHPAMIKLYTKRPSIVLAALVHEMQHINSYFDNTTFFVSMQKSDYENYYYELDAYHIEALFIKEYLVPLHYTLTDFEKFLLESFEKDYLANFSFSLLGYDMRLAFLFTDVEKKKITFEEKMAMLKKILNKIINQKILTGGKGWEMYKQLVPLFTALKFMPQITRNIMTIHKKMNTGVAYDLKSQNPEIYGILLKIQKKFIKYEKYYYTYLNHAFDRAKKI